MSKVIAVVPTYKSADLACDRIEELLQSSFYKIVICDDSSHDDTVVKLKEKYGDTIEVIAGETNRGPGGNRNRILDHELIETADYIFFLDADCQIVYSHDIAELVAKSFRVRNSGVVGFGIVNRKSEPMRWNYGDLMHPVHEAPDQKLDDMFSAGAITQEQFVAWAPARAASYRLLAEDGIKEVGWVAEGCFAVRADVFREVGGFAEEMRYHETHDLNARIQEQGHVTLFNPTTTAKHLEYDSRMNRRESDIRGGRLYYYQKHWGMSEEVFSKLFDD